MLATWNVGSRSDRDVARGLDRLKTRGVLIAGLDEAGDRRRIIEAWCKAEGWFAFFGDGSEGAASTPIIWDKRLDVTNPATRPATPATNTGRLGAGPDVVKAKVWNHVRVMGREPFVFISGHLPASLYLPRRRALAKRQIAVLADMVEHRVGRVDVIAVGDFNARPDALVLRPLRRLGMKQHSRGGTHGRRTIDHVWTLGLNGRAEVVRMPSDHKAVVFEIKEKP